MKKIYILCVLFLLCENSFGSAFVPDIYLSVGSSYSDEKISFFGLKTTDSSFSYDVSLGIRPLDIPVLGGFRLEVQYSGASTYLQHSYGTILYYDILRIIPLINPYVGLGSYLSSLKSGSYQNDNGLSYHVGFDIVLPVVGLNLFLEYRGMNFKYLANDSNNPALKMKKLDTIFGLKYYFIK